MENKAKKKMSPLVIIVLILLLMAITLCGIVVGLWFYGKSSLEQEADEPNLPMYREEQLENTEDTNQTQTDSIIEYNGKRYQYNKSMVNILLLGVDSALDPDEAYGSADQADVLVLAALNLKENKMTLINISRDIVCDVELVENDGSYAGLRHTQLAYAYTFGDGQHESCELARDAVSNVFYGLPIQGYAAYYMTGIEELNDAVGGVTVTILDDYPFTYMPEYKDMTPGKTVKLKGWQAETYIRARLEEQVDAHELRMKRQKQYMLALISTAKEKVLESPTSIMKLYDSVDDYILTDLGIGQISYLATKAAGMEFEGDLRSLSGELVEVNNMAELHVDQESLYDLMLEVFYTEVQ